MTRPLGYFQESLIKQFGVTSMMEIIDDPIVANIRATKKTTSEQSDIMMEWQSYFVEYIEIKGIHKKDTLFNSKECLLRLIVGSKLYCRFTLQLFHYSKKKEAYIYELAVPIVILSQQQYKISVTGIDGNLIIILHGKRARPLQ